MAADAVPQETPASGGAAAGLGGLPSVTARRSHFVAASNAACSSRSRIETKVLKPKPASSQPLAFCYTVVSQIRLRASRYDLNLEKVCYTLVAVVFY